MNQAKKIGILGAGFILEAHLKGFKKHPDLASITAIAVNKLSDDKAKLLKEKLGAEVEIYEGYESLLTQADIDAVDILLPHDLHQSATIAAAEAGKDILIEKVMARNIKECDAMIQTCQDNGVTLTVCHDRRYNPEWIALKNIVESGLLGKIHYWKLEHNQDVDPKGLGLDWVADRKRLGGGAVLSCLTHQIDALRWYGGDIKSVWCSGRILPDRMDGESIATMACDMADGSLAQLSINWATRSGVDTLNHDLKQYTKNGLWYELVQICGNLGEAYYLAGKGIYVCRRDEKSPRDFINCETPEFPGAFTKVNIQSDIGHSYCVSEWLKMLNNLNHNILTNGQDSRKTVEVAEAAMLSMDTNSKVSLPIQASTLKN